MKTARLLLLATGVSVPVVQAQNTPARLSQASVDMLRDRDRKHNAPLTGIICPPFEATLEDGRRFDNRSLTGKISLLIF